MLIYDNIIDKLNSYNQQGLLLLIDLEKAFDSVKWNFLDEALNFFNLVSPQDSGIKPFINFNISIPYTMATAQILF